MLAYPPVGKTDFGEGRGAVIELETGGRLDGESRVQGLHDHLAKFQVTAVDKYNSARKEIQESDGVCARIGTMGDVVL